LKSEKGAGKFPAECYAYVPDPAKPSSWRLRLFSSPDAIWPDAVLVGQSLVALFSVSPPIPSSAMPGVKARIREAWRVLHPDRRLPTVLDDRFDRSPAKERGRDA
jgi:hypothetical protein